MKNRILGKIAEALNDDFRGLKVPEVTADTIAEAYLIINEGWIKEDLAVDARERGLEYAEEIVKNCISNAQYEYLNSLPDAIEEIIDGIWEEKPPITVKSLYSVDALMMTLNESERDEFLEELRGYVIKALDMYVSSDD